MTSAATHDGLPPPLGNGGQRWLQPLLISIAVPAAMMIVAGGRYSERFDQFARHLEAVDARIAVQDAVINGTAMANVRQDQRFDGIEERYVTRTRERDGQMQDFVRELSLLRDRLAEDRAALARLEAAILGGSAFDRRKGQ